MLNLTYASGSGMGCGYEFLAVYNRSGDNLSYIGEDENSPYPSVFGDCIKRTREDLISIDKKNYILVRDRDAGLVSLNEITRSEGKEHINEVCAFSPIFAYE
jgi:hypothetical protein